MAKEYSWKDGGTAKDRKAEARRSWQRDAADGKAGGGLSRRAKLWLAFFGIAASLAAIAFLFWILSSPNPTYFVIIGADYADNLAVPPNAYGWQGLNRIRDWAQEEASGSASADKAKIKLADVPDNSDMTRVKESKFWENLSGSSRSFRGRETAVVYIGLHGTVDAQENPYFLLQDTAYGKYDPNNCLPLETVLNAIRGMKATHKVLILDANQITEHWPSGILHNGFTAALDKAMADKKNENILVISAGQQDQSSLISRRSGCTLFSDYIAQGLRGEAANRNGHVTVGSLYDYVCGKVMEDVSALYESAAQKPLLIGKKEVADNVILLPSARKAQPKDESEAAGERFRAAKDNLGDAWGKWDELRKITPAPWVYNPQDWRVYQDWLLRYEEFVMAGCPKEASRIKGNVDNLYGALKRTTTGERKSSANTLGMPLALGLPPASDINRLEFDKLWRERKGEEQKKKLREFLVEPKRSPQSQVQLVEFLLDTARTAKDEDAKKQMQEIHDVADSLTTLQTETTVNPAEGHWLRMYKYLYYTSKLSQSPTKPSADHVKQALEVRILAERSALALDDVTAGKVHPYSEQVRPWIKDDIEQADKERRQGEDLLFASQDKWAESKAHLETARKHYDAGNKIARDIRQAFQTRDRAVAELPYYVRYISLRKPDASPGEDKDIAGIRRLCEEAGKLSRQLEKGRQDSRDEINSLQSSIGRQLNGLEKDISDRSSDLFRRGKTQGDLEEMEEILSVPLIRWEAREKLLEKRDEVVRALLTSGASPAAPTPREPWLLAKRRGLLAQAFFGTPWINEHKDHSGDLYLSGLVVSGQPENWQTLARGAGAEISRACFQLVDKVKEETTKGSAENDMRKAEAMLQKADSRARMLDAAAAKTLADIPNPCLENRQLRLHDLLLWQAERAYHDHWFDEDQKPYYADYLVKNYVADAKSFVSKGREDDPRNVPRVAEAEEAQNKYTAPEELKTRGLEKWTLTSEQILPVQYDIKAPQAAFPGFPVFWSTIKENLTIKDSANGNRLALDKSNSVFKIELHSPPAKTNARRSAADIGAVGVQGVFRGQISEATTPIRYDPVPDVVAVEHYADDRAGVAVRTNEATREKIAFSNGGIVIVLDCSGSMNFQESEGPTRFQLVKTAVKGMLDRIPQGAQVSLWAFGQEIEGVHDGKYEDAEKSIKRLALVTKWNRETDLRRLKDIVDDLRATGATPLMRAMREARDDLFEVQGRRVMVVLTDGEDNRFERGKVKLFVQQNSDQKTGKEKYVETEVDCLGDPVYNATGTQRIGTFLTQEFSNRKIEIHMVGFRVESKEREKWEGQFQKPLEQELVPKGKFSRIENVEKLDQTLADILRPRLHYTVAEGPRLVTLPEGNDIIDIDSTKTVIFQRLKSGQYQVNTATTTSAKARRVDVKDGDYLLLTLTSERFIRDLYGNHHAINYPKDPRSPYRKEQDGWLASVVENYHTLDADSRKKIELMVAIESTDLDAGQGESLRQERPRFVWMEAKPRGGSTAVPLRFANVERYPAPMWQLTALDWPEIKKKYAVPELDVWWMNTEPQVIGSFKLGQLTGNRSTPLDVPIAGGNKVQVEGGDKESHKFGEKNDTSIAVRLSYPPGHPVLVRLRGISTEHQLYLKDNKYTGYFLMPVDVPDIDFEIISLKEVKSSPLHAVFTELGAPSETWRPDPVNIK